MDKSIYPCSPPIYKKISNFILFQTSVQKFTHQYSQYKYCLKKVILYNYSRSDNQERGLQEW